MTSTGTLTRWTLCTRDGGLIAIGRAGASTHGLDAGKMVIIAGRKGQRHYLDLHGGPYHTVCCPGRAADRADTTCECVEKYIILDLTRYLTEHLDDFHRHYPAWRATQWDNNTDEWFKHDGICATMPTTYPGDIAVICYAGHWLWARVHADLMHAHGGGPDDYRVTFAWEPQLLNTVWPNIPGFTPPAAPSPTRP